MIFLKNNMYSILFNIIKCDLVLIKTSYCLILINESSFHIQSSKLSQIHMKVLTKNIHEWTLDCIIWLLLSYDNFNKCKNMRFHMLFLNHQTMFLTV